MLDGIIDFITDALIGFVNILIDVVVTIVGFILDILPQMPFKATSLNWGAFGDYVGVFIPVKMMIIHFTALTGVILIWYGARYILRVIRMVG